MPKAQLVKPETYFDQEAPWFLMGPEPETGTLVQVMRLEEPIYYMHCSQRVDVDIGDGLLRIVCDNGATIYVPAPRDSLRNGFSRATSDGEFLCRLSAPILEQAKALNREGPALSAHQADLMRLARIDDPQARKELQSDGGPWARIKHALKGVLGQPSQAELAKEDDDRHQKHKRL